MDAKDRYDSLFQFYGQRSPVPWQLLKAQMLAESLADPNAVSPAGAVGLCQFMLPTWEEWADTGWDRRNSEHSIATQARYMNWLMRQFDGRHGCALAAYNWGIGNVRKLASQTGGNLRLNRLPKETQTYIERIDQILGGFSYE